MPENHAVRRAALRTALAEKGLDAVLVTRLVNVRYLTGFTGSNGALLVMPDTEVLSTDGRYITQSEAQAPDVERLITQAVTTDLVERAAVKGRVKLGFEAHDVTVEAHGRLTAVTDKAELLALGWAVEALRAVKDEDEIALLRRACGAADDAVAELWQSGLEGRSEKDIGADLESRMRAHGADGPSFETIVASGPNSAVPHHRPTDRVVERGDFVKFDFGALVEGYHSDMTRTVVVGEPADWQREVHALVATAQQAGIDALRVGAISAELDKAARDVIEAAGHGEHYTHSLGHGVGLEIHEAPSLRKDGSDALADRMPVTVEPGVYLPGRGGVRIEDTLVVRPDGPESLTTTTKELLVLA
ncbi:MAG TPA: aminopeptidase P family protein [Mycobacteriales bacterium]|nr:aminopeptidase P family protein [Mycobacteriales bacterium]